MNLNDTGNWILMLTKELIKNKKEFDLTVAFHDKKIKTIKFEDRKSLNIIRIPLSGKSNNIVKFLSNWSVIDKYKSAKRDYLEIINQIKPDLIQIFGLESPFIRIIPKVIAPILIHIQGLMAPYIYKYYSRFNSIQILRASGLTKNIC